MHPDAKTLWRGPRWALALLLAALSMIGPFAIDAYLPAFAGIGASLSTGPVQMQQTLSAYLFCFALMNLFHGALSDSLGRRPVVLAALSLFALASVGCALSTSIGSLVFFRAVQGLSAGGGMVVGRAIIRDLFPVDQAQRVMSQVTIFFGLAPVLAPMVGGLLYDLAGWHAVFWMLAGIGGGLVAVMWSRLPESLHDSQRQPFEVGNLLRGYAGLLSDLRFLALAVASAVPFSGMFLYVLAAPVWLGEHLQLKPTQFFWYFALNVSGMMSAAWCSGRLAGRITHQRQLMIGFGLMACASIVNLGLNLSLAPHVGWALLPLTVYSFGWSLTAPVVTLMLLDLAPTRRGMASSVQSFLSGVTNGVTAGLVVPAVMHSTGALAGASTAMLGLGLAAWAWGHRRPAPG